MTTLRLHGWALVLTVIVLVSLSCSSSHQDRVVVGSKNFTESLLLGEIIAQEIEAKTSLKVERRFYLAGTYICQQAILAGRIDLYPEYTGTALTAILKQTPRVTVKVFIVGWRMNMNVDSG